MLAMEGCSSLLAMGKSRKEFCTTMTICVLFLFSLFLLFSVTGCRPLVNAFAFHPNSRGVIAASELPAGVEEMAVVAEDGVRLMSLYLASNKSKKLVIYFHGNAGSVYGRLSDLQRLHAVGVSVIGVSYRGYGKSEGRPSERGLYRDGRAVLNHAVEHLGFKKEDIILFGRSIGTTVAVHTAQDEVIDGLVLVSPLTRGQEVFEKGILRLLAPLAGRAFDNMSKMKRIRSRLLVVHGTDDGLIPLWMGEKIFESAQVEKQLVKIEGAGHNDLSSFEAGYWGPVLGFVLKQQQGQPTP